MTEEDRKQPAVLSRDDLTDKSRQHQCAGSRVSSRTGNGLARIGHPTPGPFPDSCVLPGANVAKLPETIKAAITAPKWGCESGAMRVLFSVYSFFHLHSFRP